jgi:exonuclease SbcC
VRLNSLHLVNFRQHPDTYVEFDLGLTGIIGPNGAGKTTILEAIAWALYGQSAARGTRETLRFSRAPARAAVKVELDFELAGHRYRVVRGLTSAELYLDGANAPIANSISGVSDLIQRRVGMTRAEFFNTYFTGQKELNVMAAMGPSERAQFLSRVLGYDRLRTAQSLVRDRRKMIMAEGSGLRAVMPDPDAVERMLAESRLRLDDAERRRREAERAHRDSEAALGIVAPRWLAAQRARDEQQALLAELRVCESEEQARARERERLARELRQMDEARVELGQLAVQLAPLADMGAEFRRQEELAREEGRRQTLGEQERLLADELSQLRQRRESRMAAMQQEESVTERLERARAERETVEGRLEAARTEWVRDRQDAQTKRDELRRQYADVKAQRDKIVDLGEEGECPTCTRKLGASFRGVLEQLEGQLETIAVDGRYFSTRLEQLEEMPGEVRQLDERRRELQQAVVVAERELARVQAQVQEVAQLGRDVSAKEQRLANVRAELARIPQGYDAARHAELQRETQRLAGLNDRATRLSALIDREAELRKEHARNSEELERLGARVAELRARRAATEFSEVEYAKLREEHDQASALARSAEVAMATARADAATARAAMENAERAQRELLKAQERYLALQREKRLHDELDRAYSDLRTDLNFQLRPELSELASSFLSDLTDGRYTELELDDQYNVVVLEDGMPKPVISGGEEDLSNLVLRLAISQMIAERAGQSFSLLVLDEVFGSLDEARRGNVIELLRRLQDRFEQVILITHIESVREGLDRVITVGYDEQTGGSVVRQVEPGAVPDELTDAFESARVGAAGGGEVEP